MSPEDESAVRVETLHHRYAATTALDGVSLTIRPGSTVAFIGPDGVGKSTLLGLIAGVKRIQSGTVKVLGGDMASRLHRDAVAPRIAYMPQGLGRNLYPTQAQANDAYRRLLADAPPDSLFPASLRVFGCKPGALDEQTARVTRYRGPLVHCAVDFLDAAGRPVVRETANFYYSHSAWRMQPVHPPRALVPWRNPEKLSQDVWRWVPGRDRYE